MHLIMPVSWALADLSAPAAWLNCPDCRPPLQLCQLVSVMSGEADEYVSRAPLATV